MSFFKKQETEWARDRHRACSHTLQRFFLAALIGINREYEEEACFDRNLTGKPVPRDEFNKTAEQCTKKRDYRRTHSHRSG
jgi:hypothetical protein